MASPGPSLLMWLLAGCVESAPDPVAHLARASLAIRGVRPSADEIRAVSGDPGRLDGLVRDWVSDPLAGDVIRDMHAEQFLLRFDVRGHLEPLGPLAGYERSEIVASLDEEPLRLIERIVTGGRPYTEIVTAGSTAADPIVAAAYGLAHDPAGPTWQEAAWRDGRPAAGILSSTSWLQRYMSSTTNHHRSRASFVMAKLLCEPFPASSVISDPNVVDALDEEPGCAGCHRVLDPIASAFFGFQDYVLASDNRAAELAGCPDRLAHQCMPLPMWDPALVADRERDGMPAPGLAGEPVGDLAGLGRRIAADPRFATCTARRFLSWYGQVPLEEVPDDLVERYAGVLVDADWDARVLILDLVRDPAFAPGGWAGPQHLRPEQLARTVEALTGYRWQTVRPDYGPVDQLTTDAYGYRLLLGGVDGWDAVVPVHAPTATRELALARLAESAADHAVDTGRWPPGGLVDQPAQVRRAMRELALLVLSDPDADIEPLYALFADTLARRGGREREDLVYAWKVAVTALLLDPRAVTY